jgi:uncharacterized protein (DUF427 family)
MKAIWNNTVIAESDQTIVLEGNHYFPIESIHEQYFQESLHTSICGWKGLANYYNVVVEGQENPNAAWIYKTPKEQAQEIKNHIAFWKGISVIA